MAHLYDQQNIRSHLLCKVIIPEYKIYPGDTPQAVALTFSDLNRGNNIVYDGYTYIGLGVLMGVTTSNSELKPSSSELTITVTGIPNESIYQILNSKIKGCQVIIYRVICDGVTGEVLNLIEANPFARFRGFVNNYSLQEEYDVNTRTSRNTMLLICKSSLDVLQNKIAGRLTNPTSEKKYFPYDLSMDRVPALQNTSFNFGAPKA
jgi:hypothetical protein